jgi:hypothetical protein
MTSDASITKNPAKDRPDHQKITLRCAGDLTEQQRAGQPLTADERAECGAEGLVGPHVKTAANGRDDVGLGARQSELRGRLATAQMTDDLARPDLETPLDDVTTDDQPLVGV